MMNDLITVADAARILNLSPSRIYHIRHKLPHIKCGDKQQSRVLFLRDKIVEAYQNI